MIAFEPTRTAALTRLSDFLPRAGRDYAAQRNYDRPAYDQTRQGGVSALSPYLRHRAMTEAEVLEATLARFSLSTAGKFVQEVYWRTYWKGWLELRPEVWTRYLFELGASEHRLASESGLRRDWKAACTGDTGIDCFDHWARELADTGYLHNHARMWFASIWVFTLRLPWVLGADLFLRHLLDGDPASNTLSWRWVSGLQTRGKTYLARPDNIRKYTDGRFDPKGLAAFAAPLEDAPFEAPRAAPVSAPRAPGRTGVLLHWEDLSPTELMRGEHSAAAILEPQTHGTLHPPSAKVQEFRRALTDDAAARYGIKDAPRLTAAELPAWAETQGITQIATAYAPVGPIAEELSNVPGLKPQLRAYDSAAWPHATKGFFKFKEKIPKLIAEAQGLRAL